MYYVRIDKVLDQMARTPLNSRELAVVKVRVTRYGDCVHCARCTILYCVRMVYISNIHRQRANIAGSSCVSICFSSFKT